MLIRTGRIGPALDQGEKGRRLLEELIAESPREFKVRSYLSACCNNLGAGYIAAGRAAEAETFHRRALELRAALARDYPLMPNIRMSLVQSRNNLGDLFFTTGRHADAKAQYREAVSLFEALEGTTTAAVLGSLAESRVSLALVLQTVGRKKEAATEYAAADAVLVKVVADYPGQPRYAVSLASCYVNQAQLPRVREAGKRAALVRQGHCGARSHTRPGALPRRRPRDRVERPRHEGSGVGKPGPLHRGDQNWDCVVELGSPQNLPVSRFLRAAAW